MKTLKYLSLFSGIGGFEYGLEQSIYNFENVGFSEIDRYAKSIYKKRYPNHIDLGDATEIDPKGLQDFDLLVGGFPCQAFSISGYRKGFADCRGTLFFEIARICEEKKPRYLLLENVKGLLSHDGGRTYKKMLGVLSELGYDVEWEVYNSKSFGVPQNRERLYIKGYFRAKCGREILSQRRNYAETDTQLDAFKFNRQVKKRVHDVDYKELRKFLRDAKKSSKVTVDEISQKLNKPRSEVEHWFRDDDYFAPPTDDIWLALKEILGIDSDKYDKFMLEFEWVDGVYEMDKRAYDEKGLSPTLTTRDESLVKINVVDNTSPSNHRGDDVFGTDGISRTLTASNYKHPLKVKVADDIEIEKVWNTTRKFNGSTTDGSYCPTLTASMGTGGGNVPMMKLKTNTKKGYDEVTEGDGVRLCHPGSKTARGRSEKGQSGALSTSADWGTVDRNFRIRRLTPKECERLQAFPDDWTMYGENDELISDTQRYKCLGNAVTTTVVTHIANNMFRSYFEEKS